MFAPLTSLVGECSQTKISKAKGTKKVLWHWDEVHQRAFDHVKATIAKDVVLAYPDYSKVFEIYTKPPSATQLLRKTGDTMVTSSFGPYHGLWLDDAPTKRA